MQNKFILNKFTRDPSNPFNEIRQVHLTNGKILTFRVAGTDLSVMATENKSIDFDQESDTLIENHSDSDHDIKFDYIKGFGFHDE